MLSLILYIILLVEVKMFPQPLTQRVAHGAVHSHADDEREDPIQKKMFPPQPHPHVLRDQTEDVTGNAHHEHIVKLLQTVHSTLKSF